MGRVSEKRKLRGLYLRDKYNDKDAMSSSNYLFIEKIKDKYRLSDMDSNTGNAWCIIKDEIKDLETAVRLANKYEEQHYVENGLSINLEDEKIT